MAELDLCREAFNPGCKLDILCMTRCIRCLQAGIGLIQQRRMNGVVECVHR
ncbi:MAG: hypothetical protein ACI845_004091 [Gammaproteobacteria bacterium]|jgi:hypothetical protein